MGAGVGGDSSVITKIIRQHVIGDSLAELVHIELILVASHHLLRQNGGDGGGRSGRGGGGGQQGDATVIVAVVMVELLLLMGVMKVGGEGWGSGRGLERLCLCHQRRGGGGCDGR